MIAFISDIHGNLPALKAVLGRIDALGCTKTVCLGDVAGYYPQVNECISLLREREIPSLLGNHDYYLISNTCCSSKTVKICLEYQKTILSAENLNWLKGNSPSLDGETYSLRHGGWQDALEERFSKFDFSWVADLPQRIFISGHTHIQNCIVQEYGNRLYCNPGSVGQPRDGDPRAAFAVWDEKETILLQRVPYDIDEVVHQMNKAGLGEWIWKGLYTGTQIGK
ncbi:MAG: metallophosphoesterase family protein [Firmicutes bacterium]|nr:metallophosphoesterase family protein [Bacillota bacterium]